MTTSELCAVHHISSTVEKGDAVTIVNSCPGLDERRLAVLVRAIFSIDDEALKTYCLTKAETEYDLTIR